MNWWHYLLLVNIYLVLFYAFYALLLRKETFFQLNRVYLVAAALLSFFIPLIQSEWVKNLFITEQVRYSIYGGGPISIYAFKPVQSSPVTVGQVLTVLYLAGIVFLTLRFILQLIRVNRLINAPSPAAAYSFFKKISLGENLVKQDVIMAHEQVHARQWHSVDVLLIEAVMIINWFNPVVYLYRFAVKHIHEFIADQQALKVGADKAEYALLLLSQTFSAPSHQLVNPFFTHSLLKKRIIMIQKNKSHRIVLFKYILSAPLFGLMLILSSATINNSKAISAIHTKAGNVFSEPAVATITEFADQDKIPDQLNDDAGDDYNNPQTKIAGHDTIPNKIYDAVEKEPMFPGGQKAFSRYLAKTIKYPAAARKARIEGKVYISFVIERDGSITDAKVRRGPGHGLNEEALKAIRNSPKWRPGIQNGKRVRVEYTVPVNFTLSSVRIDEPPTASGRTEPTTDDRNIVYDAVDKEPTFPGGPNGFNNFLSKNVKYPAVDRNNNITGKVFVQFVVEKDGSLTDIKALRGPSETTMNEAVRAIGTSPKWQPGIQNGHAVRVSYTVPVNFTLNSDNSIAPSAEHKPVNGVYSTVEKEPTFPGGPGAFNNFLSKNVRYPAVDRENNITGKVFVQFVVEKDGTLTDVKALRGPSETMKEAAVTALNQSPAWIPGTQNGMAVRVQYTVPVNFTLSSDESVINNAKLSHPLILVDGVEVNSISDVDPANIKSIVVLKTADAKAVYGSKGANGVITITTKNPAPKPTVKK